VIVYPKLSKGLEPTRLDCSLDGAKDETIIAVVTKIGQYEKWWREGREHISCMAAGFAGRKIPDPVREARHVQLC